MGLTPLGTAPLRLARPVSASAKLYLPLRRGTAQLLALLALHVGQDPGGALLFVLRRVAPPAREG